MLLIKNGRLTDPRTGCEGERDILIEGDKIARIAKRGALDHMTDVSDLQVYDASGLIVSPGLVDVHVHFRDPGFPYKEDIGSGSRAAAAGGFTTVVLMANTKPVVDNPQVLAYVLERGRECGIRVESCCAITKGLRGKELTDMSHLLQAGAVGFTDDGAPLLDADVAERAMREAKRLGTVLSFHEEDPAYIANNGVNAGRVAAHFGIAGSDRAAEITMVQRDISLAEKTGALINIQHISAKESVALVRRARERGVRVHAEATPHHFSLTQEAVPRWGTLAKMNPPLREEADRLAIIEGLRDGTIDLIATDHAPHSRQEKEKPITEAPSGIIGLETALPLGLTYLVKPGHLTLPELLAKMSCNPAALYGLDRGYLAEGGPADVTLFDPEETFCAEKFVSKSSNSPFIGKKLTGKVKCTICRGRIVYREERNGLWDRGERKQA